MTGESRHVPSCTSIITSSSSTTVATFTPCTICKASHSYNGTCSKKSKFSVSATLTNLVWSKAHFLFIISVVTLLKLIDQLQPVTTTTPLLLNSNAATTTTISRRFMISYTSPNCTDGTASFLYESASASDLEQQLIECRNGVKTGATRSMPLTLAESAFGDHKFVGFYQVCILAI